LEVGPLVVYRHYDGDQRARRLHPDF
jgi:hypothetical protein